MEQHHKKSLDPNPPAPIKSQADWYRAAGIDPESEAARNRKPPDVPAGLGDLVEKIAKPVARSIDKAFGTNIEGCGGCKKRKEYLNEKFPIT